MEHEKFHYKKKKELIEKLEELKVHLPLSDNIDVLKRPVSIGAKTAANSIAIQPMEGCDCLLYTSYRGAARGNAR